MAFLIENAYAFALSEESLPTEEPIFLPATGDYSLLVFGVIGFVGLALLYFIVVRPLMRRKGYPEKTSKSEESSKRVEDKSEIVKPEKFRGKGKIFLSYRRNDSADVTGRIYDRLLSKFGDDNVFKDVDSIPLGADFKEHIDSMIKESVVVLVVMGNDWFGGSNKDSGRRIDDPGDFVRLEVAVALERKLNIVPLLVRKAQMPTEAELPEELKPLAYRNGISIRPDPDFNNDIDRLIHGVEKIIAEN